jgi:serine protease Do
MVHGTMSTFVWPAYMRVRNCSLRSSTYRLKKHLPSRAPDKEDQPEREHQPPQDDQKKSPVQPHGETAQVPEAMQPYIKQRAGFANYYFNELNRTRVWNAFHDMAGDFATIRGDWTLSKGEEITITLGDSASSIKTATATMTLDREQDLSEQLEPPGSGGMLAALHLWRRLLVEGPTAFGDVVYVGTAPLIGHDGLYDVLLGTFDVVETTFYFDPVSGELRAVEMAPDSGVDPCEIYLSDYREVTGTKLPHRMQIRHGDNIFLELDIESIQLSKSEKPEA